MIYLEGQQAQGTPYLKAQSFEESHGTLVSLGGGRQLPPKIHHLLSLPEDALTPWRKELALLCVCSWFLHIFFHPEPPQGQYYVAKCGWL